MALPLVPIYTQTVGAGGAASVTFNNIPQYFTDLKVVVSARGSFAYDAGNVGIGFNNDTSALYSNTHIYMNQNGSGSYRDSGQSNYIIATIGGTTITANTFNSVECYIPNYTGSNFKSGILDGVSEANSITQMRLELVASLYRSTNAITSIKFTCDANFVQYSTFSLYGILRSGA